jgi:hypothetical protein
VDEETGGEVSWKRILVSLVILGTLGLQGSQTFRFDLVAKRLGVPESLRWRLAVPYLFPFLDYPMYSLAHYEGETVPRYRIYGITADGTELAIDHRALDIKYFLYRKSFLWPVQRQEATPELLALVDVFERRSGATLKALRLENSPVSVTAEGLRDEPAETLLTFALPPRPEQPR